MSQALAVQPTELVNEVTVSGRKDILAGINPRAVLGDRGPTDSGADLHPATVIYFDGYTCSIFKHSGPTVEFSLKPHSIALNVIAHAITSKSNLLTVELSTTCLTTPSMVVALIVGVKASALTVPVRSSCLIKSCAGVAEPAVTVTE